jgi:hypothetical protein
MSKIKDLYRNYFQKSRIFLYPALDIKKGNSVTPIETYISWKGYVEQTDRRLICLYHLRNDVEYRTFEKSKLLKSSIFEDFREVEGGKGVYIFNYDMYSKDWQHFLNGEYSKFSFPLKKKIRDFIGSASSNSVYVDSYLYPEKYYRIYADILGVDEDTLRSTGQLCDKPDFNKELLEISVKDLQINKIIT